MKYHAQCDECHMSVDTDDHSTRADLVGRHRLRTGHNVTMTDDPEYADE